MHHCKSTSVLCSINAYLSEVLCFLFIPQDKKVILYSVPSSLSSSSNSQGNQGSHSFTAVSHSAVSKEVMFACCFKSLQSFP